MRQAPRVRMSPANVERILHEANQWVEQLEAAPGDAAPLDDVTRSRLANSLRELAQLGRQLGGFAPKGA